MTTTIDKPKSRFQQLIQTLQQALSLVEAPGGLEPTDRAMAGWRLSNQVWDLIDYSDWLLDIYYGEGGEMFALVADSNANLYQVPITIVNDSVVMGERVAVQEMFVPVSQSNTPKMRTFVQNGKRRWAMIAATSVVNRVGELDSKGLFDDFIQHFNNGDYATPFLTFYHEDTALEMGTVTDIMRHGNVLFVAGDWHENNSLADACIRALENDPDGEWGVSVGFMPLAAPEIITVGSGVEIPVYQSGYLIEVSMLLERHAANWFTRFRNGRIQRMSKVTKEMLERVFGENSAELEDWAGKLDDTERAITQSGLITRDADTEADSDGAGAAELETEAQAVDVVLDDATITGIAEALLANDSFRAALVDAAGATMEETALAEVTQGLLDRMERMEKRLADTAGDVDALLSDAEQQQQSRQSDAPRRTMRLTTTTRPRVARSEDVPTNPARRGGAARFEKTPDGVDFADQANTVLDRIPE